MKLQTPQHNTRRSGLIALEVVMSLSITFTFAMVMFIVGQEACFRLYQFIAAMVGSPVW